MKSTFWAASFLLAFAPVSLAARTKVEGTWAVEFVSGLAMKTIGGAKFEFKVDGDNLTGIADVGMGWPGKAPISNGKIDGRHISFTVFGRQPSSDGLPKMGFVGTAHGDKIKLTMTFYANGKNITGHTNFVGTRVP